MLARKTGSSPCGLNGWFQNLHGIPSWALFVWQREAVLCILKWLGMELTSIRYISRRSFFLVAILGNNLDFWRGTPYFFFLLIRMIWRVLSTLGVRPAPTERAAFARDRAADYGQGEKAKSLTGSQ